jgi:hypothetical protein
VQRRQQLAGLVVEFVRDAARLLFPRSEDAARERPKPILVRHESLAQRDVLERHAHQASNGLH